MFFLQGSTPKFSRLHGSIDNTPHEAETFASSELR
jgi:hypothetical protein